MDTILLFGNLSRVEGGHRRPIALVFSIHFLTERVKRFKPASILIPLNSGELKTGLWSCSQNKAVQTGLYSKPIEFDGFRIGVVELLPDAEKLYGVAVAQPVLNDVVGPLRIAVPGNVGQRNVVVLFL